jgi:hypothetical protein
MLLVRELRMPAQALLLYSVVALTSCGGGNVSSSGGSGNSVVPGSSAQPGGGSSAGAQRAMVVMLVEENHAYEQVMGNAAMPYLNSLAQQGGVATQYYANMHPSLPNYFALTTGATQTNDNNFPGPVTADNLARELIASGKTWKVYAEDLPSPGYLGTTVGNYIKHHNPFAYFSDVVNSPSQAANIVPFTQFASDVSTGSLSDFIFIVPNVADDSHECIGFVCNDNDVLIRADQWLKTNIAPLVATPRFQSSGLLLITFDEANLADLRNGGGRVALIAVGPKAKAGVQSSTFYKHENTLKTVCVVLGLASCPGPAASVSAETDLIQQ